MFADVIPPVVVSITRVNSNPSTAASVAFLVTFTEPVIGVDKFDFALITTGTLSGVSISSTNGTGYQRTLVVLTGNGRGTLRLDLIDNDSIRDIALNRLGGTGLGNGDFTTGEVYSIRP